MSPAISGKKGRHSHQQLPPSHVSPRDTQEGEEHMGPGSHQAAATPYGEPQRKKVQFVKNTGYRPQMAEVHTEGMI